MNQLKTESNLIKSILQEHEIYNFSRYNDKRKKSRRLAYKAFNSENIAILYDSLKKKGILGWDLYSYKALYGYVFVIYKKFPL